MSASLSTVGTIGHRSADGLTDLLTRSATGDQSAFAELHDAVAPRIYGLVLRVLRDHAQAEEVCQEVLLEMWRTAARFDAARGSALAWTMTIAHRKAVDRVRSAEASSRRDTRYTDSSHEVAYDVTAEAATASADGRRVAAALANLVEGQRTALTLAYFGGYTHMEVADRLGIPLGTAKTRIRQGLIGLRNALGPGFDPASA